MFKAKLTSPKKTFFLLNSNVHKALKKAAAKKQLSMGEALRRAVQLWLDKSKSRPRKGA